MSGSPQAGPAPTSDDSYPPLPLLSNVQIDQQLGTSSTSSRHVRLFQKKKKTLDTRLSEVATYPEWVMSKKNYLDLAPAGENGVWDVLTTLREVVPTRLVITGEYAKPAETAIPKTMDLERYESHCLTNN